MMMVFAGGHVSGGHYNPAVTLGVWLGGKCEAKDVAPYMMSRIVGSILAALAVRYLKVGAAVTPMSLNTLPALLAEFLFTFCAGFCGVEYGDSERYSGKLVLWAGHRLYSDVRSFCRRKHFRRSVQPSGGGRNFCNGIGSVAEYLGLLVG